MKIKRIKKDWWKNFFDEIYLITDSRSVCDSILTSREVDLLEDILHLNRRDKIFDLCGGYGRHSLELAKRGYRDLTVLDYSHYLVRLGKKMAKKAGLNIKFFCRDARNSGLRSNSYSKAFIMANSFGYFSDESENFIILQEMHRLLQVGGRVLLDLADPDYVKRHLRPLSWHEANKDIIVCRKRELQDDIIKAREIVVSKKRGLLRDGFYCERVYTKDKIIQLLKNAGFKDLCVKKNLSLHKKKKDYGLMTTRMFVTAVKS
jgi:D-alanine-D-alanine ligase